MKRIVLALALTAAVWAQPSKGEADMVKADEATRKGDLGQAAIFYSAASHNFPEGLDQAKAFHRWAEVELQRDRPASARRPYQKALDLYDQFKGPESRESGAVCLKLGEIYLQDHQARQAERYLTRAVAIERKSGRWSNEQLRMTYELAQACIDNSHLDLAEDLLEQVLPRARGASVDQGQRLLAEIQKRRAPTVQASKPPEPAPSMGSAPQRETESYRRAEQVWNALLAERKIKLANDPEAAARVDEIGQKVAAASKRNVPWHFFVVQDRQVNAFTLGEGFVAVTTALLDLQLNDSELAGVLAHEVAHGTQQHTMRKVNNDATVAAAEKEIRDAQAQEQRYQQEYAQNHDEEMYNARMVSVRNRLAAAQKRLDYVSGQQKFAKEFKHEDEIEADQVGMRYAATAGYQPDGLISALTRIQAAGVKTFGQAYTGEGYSHPSTARRLDTLNKVYLAWKSQGYQK